MRNIRFTRYVTAIQAMLVTALLAPPAHAQDHPIDLSGIWWSGAPTPLLPGETPAIGMGGGMGMGTSSSALMLTDHGLEIMADFDPADDPAVRCVQSGLVRTFNSPYPIDIVQSGDTVTIEYEEWEVLRTVHLNGSVPENHEPSSLGYSIGRYEDDALIVNSTGATRGLARVSEFFWISEEMSSVERYSLTERGQLRLELDITDPVMLAEPYHYEKTWNPFENYDLLDFDCTLRER